MQAKMKNITERRKVEDQSKEPSAIAKTSRCERPGSELARRAEGKQSTASPNDWGYMYRRAVNPPPTSGHEFPEGALLENETGSFYGHNRSNPIFKKNKIIIINDNKSIKKI